MKTIHRLSLVLLIALITGCSSFNNRGLRKQIKKLNSNNIDNISGIYECSPYELYNFHYGKLSIVKVKTKNHVLDRMLLNEAFNYQPLNALDSLEINRSITVKIKIDVQNQLLHMEDYHNKVEQFSASIPFTIKKGFLYLDNKKMKNKGVPFIYHSSSKSKVRIGLSEEGNLYIQRYSSSYGSIFIMSAGNASESAYTFKRIST